MDVRKRRFIMKVFRDAHDISVKVGEDFGIALKVLSASGYEWHVVRQPDLVQPLGSEFKVATASVGAESEQILRFKSRKAGEAVLDLECKTAWDAQPYQTRSIKIKVVK